LWEKATKEILGVYSYDLPRKTKKKACLKEGEGSGVKRGGWARSCPRSCRNKDPSRPREEDEL